MQIQTLPIWAAALSPLLITLIVVLVVVIVAIVVLSIVGRRLQRRQTESQEAMKAAAQTVSILVIDKKRMKIKDAGLPKIVVEQTPKYLRASKVPIVKAKIGPQIMSLMCDDGVFNQLPIKKELRVVLSGIYIMAAKDSRHLLAPTKKQGFFKRMQKKAKDYVAEDAKTDKSAKGKKGKK